MQQQEFDTDTFDGCLKAMMVEGVGHNMLDSGGAYGYIHDKNRKLPPWEKPRLLFGSDGDLEGLNLWHFLHELDSIERNESALKHEKDFRAWVEASPKDSDLYFNSTGSVAKWCKERGYKYRGATNSYNGECSLSQVILWCVFEGEDGEEILALSLHNGCDVRGGYTNLRFFESSYDALPHDGLLGWWCSKCNFEGRQYDRDESKPLPTKDPAAPELLCPRCKNTLSVRIE